MQDTARNHNPGRPQRRWGVYDEEASVEAHRITSGTQAGSSCVIRYSAIKRRKRAELAVWLMSVNL